MAAELLRRLEEERKIDVKGDCECCNQCDLSVPVSVAKTKWWYEPNKNKWKLRKQARRAKKLRSQRQGTGQMTAEMPTNYRSMSLSCATLIYPTARAACRERVQGHYTFVSVSTFRPFLRAGRLWLHARFAQLLRPGNRTSHPTVLLL